MIAFSAMTWNVENLFRPDAGAGDADERERYRRKLGLLADVIGRLAPDVVALQEVGGDEPLADLQEALDGAYSPWTNNENFPRPGSGKEPLRSFEAMLCGGYFFVPPLVRYNRP